MHLHPYGLAVLLAGLFSCFAQATFRVQTIAGSNLAGDGSLATQALLQQPEGVAVAPDGTLFVTDAADHRIRAVSPSGDIRTIAGDGSPGFSGDGGPAAKARLRSPYGLSLDRQGNLYIADLGNARIRLIAPDGTIRTVAGGGAIPAGDAADGSPATSLKFTTPRNVLADPFGGFYLSDFDAHRVYFVDFRGILTIFAGTGFPGYGADNIAATRSALRNPAGLAFEPQGGVIIVESGAQRLRRVARGTISAFLSDALRYYPLYSPTGVAFDMAGNMYLADARATGALKRTPQGEITALPLSGRAVAADPRGGACYAWNNAVYRVDLANKVALAAGGAAPGIGELTGDGGLAENARLLAPAGLAYDRDGNLYVADERAHRIRRVTPSGLITTVAGTGRAGYSGDGGPAFKAALNAPRGLAFDPSGNLYIADSANHAVRLLSPSGTITSVAGNGFPGFRGDGGPASAALLHSPSAVAIDPNGDLFIADTANHRVRRVNRAGLIATFAGSGAPGLAFDGAAAVFAQLHEPRGLAFDPSGNLYIADSANNRIRMVDLTGLLTTFGEPAFSSPRAVTVALDGSLYVADTAKHRICQIVNGTTRPVAGGASPGFAGDGGPALDAEFQDPAALVFDPLGNLAIADSGNARVRQLRPEAVLVSSELQSDLRLVNAANGVETPAVSGMLATLRGTSLGPAEPLAAPAGAPWPSLLGATNVYIDGEPAPLLFVSPEQINFQFPASIGARNSVRIEVFHQGTLRAQRTASVAPAAPGLYPQIFHEDGSVNSLQNPAPRGSVVALLVTGTGAFPAGTAEIRIGTMAAQITAAALAAPGLWEFRLRLPSGFFPSGSHPVQFKIGGIAAAAPSVVLQ